MRLEAEEAEREAARSAAMRRSFREVAAELMAHGDTVRVGLATGETLQGEIRHVGIDYLSIETPTRRFDVRLEAITLLEVAVRALQGGRSPSRDQAPGWRARLLELELSGSTVDVATCSAEEWTGKVTQVGSDHLCLTSRPERRERFLPFAAVAFVAATDSRSGDADD
jgi:hypothetical protein